MTTSPQPLPKSTRTGFTMLPNRFIDDLLMAREKYTSDSLALALYLVRHIPAQSGTLALVGDFSQASICEDLGWGRTNRARLKRAISELEDSSIVKCELRDNNTLLLHITADLNSSAPAPVTLAGQGGRKESSQGGAKILSAPGRENFSQASRAPASQIPNLSHENKNTTLNNLHHSEVICNTTAREIPRMDDDDVKRLLTLYRSELKKAITPRAGMTFAENYQLNGRPFDLVAKAIQTLSSHPLLQRDTTSPNAVWELPYMQTQARTYDARIRSYLHGDLARRSDADYVKELREIASRSGCDPSLTVSYFQADIDALLAEQAACKASWGRDIQDDEENSTGATGDAESEPPEPADDASAHAGTAEAAKDAPPSSPSISADAAPETTPDAAEPANASVEPPQAHFAVQPIDAPSGNAPAMVVVSDSDPQDAGTTLFSVPELAPTCNLRAALKPISSDPIPKQTPVDRSRQTDCALPSELATATSKAEIVRLIAKALAAESDPDRRRRLVVVSELAAAERMSFLDLKTILRRHLAPPGAAKAA